jgi:hypothetical protein
LRKESKLEVGTIYTNNFSRFDHFIQVIESKCEIPDYLELVEIQDDIQQNKEDVIRVRYVEKELSNQLYGPHFSVVIRKEDEVILGFVNLTTEMTVGSETKLPSREETKILAKNFFEAFQTGLFERLKNLWIDRHEERIEIDHQEKVVAGTKYKCFIEGEENYGWIVFGKDKSPIIFERNINWVNSRTTEKWLHDSYLESGTLDLHPVRTKQ